MSVCLCVCVCVCLCVCLCTKCVSKFFSAVYKRIIIELGKKVCTDIESRMHKYDVIYSKVKVTVRSYLEIIKFYLSQLFFNRFSRNLAKILYGESTNDS